MAEPSTQQASQAILKDKKRPFAILAAITGVVVVGIALVVIFNMGKENTDDAQIDADVVPLSVRAGGLVIKALVQENQAVKAGEIIMQLDPNEQSARVKQAEAELATSLAQLKSAQAQVAVVEATAQGGLQTARAALSGSSIAITSADSAIAVAKAGMERARADLRRTQLDLTRAQTLRQANAIPQEKLDNAQSAFDEADAMSKQSEAQLKQAQVTREAAQLRVGEARGHLGENMPAEARVATAQAAAELAMASVKAAEARLALQKLMFDWLTVTAPVDGVISRMSAHEGQLLMQGQAVAEIVPNFSYVTANFKETQTGKMHPGQIADISVDAFSGRSLVGKVVSLSGGTGARFSLLPPDNATGNFVKVVQRVPVRIELIDPPKDMALRAGLSCDVTVHVKD